MYSGQIIAADGKFALHDVTEDADGGDCQKEGVDTLKFGMVGIDIAF
jgi:hypothetical protein